MGFNSFLLLFATYQTIFYLSVVLRELIVKIGRKN